MQSGLVEEWRKPVSEGDILSMRVILDRRLSEFKDHAVQLGHAEGYAEARERGLEQQRILLSSLAEQRFGDGTAAHLTEVPWEVTDPEHLSDMSGLILDCATGRELVADAERIAKRD